MRLKNFLYELKQEVHLFKIKQKTIDIWRDHLVKICGA